MPPLGAPEPLGAPAPPLFNRGNRGGELGALMRAFEMRAFDWSSTTVGLVATRRA